MRILKYNYLIKANIEHVFDCHQDFDFVCDTMNKFRSDQGFKAVRKGDEIYFSLLGYNNKLIANEAESDRPKFLKIEIRPEKKHLERYGILSATCEFVGNADATSVTTEFFIDKNPALFWRALIKLIAKYYLFRSKRYEKQYVEEIEQCA